MDVAVVVALAPLPVRGQPGRASPFFGPFLRSAGGDGLHS